MLARQKRIILGSVFCLMTMCVNVKAENKVRLILPKEIPVVAGVDLNIYFDNIVLVENLKDYKFKVNCKKGEQEENRWKFSPESGDAGIYPLEISVSDNDNELMETMKVSIRVIQENEGKSDTLTLLCIGDSLTHAFYYTRDLLNLFAKKEKASLLLVGTHFLPGEPNNRHEGYGGWTAYNFVKRYNPAYNPGKDTIQSRSSPFIYLDENGSPSLDIQRYLNENNNGKAPNFITIFLGINDLFSANDNNIENNISNFLSNLDTLIEAFHSVSSDIKIGIVTVPPANILDSAFEANYKGQYTRWQWRKNQHRLVERTIESYEGRESENIYLIPAYLNLDESRHYPSNNAVHPNPSGYTQIAKSIYCWIKSCMKK